MRSIIYGPNQSNGNAAAQANGGIRRLSATIDTVALTANSASTYAVPAGTEWVFFNASTATGVGIPLWGCDASIGTAAAPSGNITATGSELNPTGWNVRGVANLSLLSNVTGYVYITRYANLDSTSTT